MNPLPRLLPTLAMLLLLCLAAIAGYSFRDFTDGRPAGTPEAMPALDPQVWMSSSPSPDAETADFKAATGELAESSTETERPSGEGSKPLAETILQGTGETWRQSSDEARSAMSRMIAAWLHADAPAADLDQWARGYQQQLDELSRQPQAAAAKISDWLPLVHGHLLTQPADGPSS